MIRKAAGLLLAAAGIGIIFYTLPSHLWFILLGVFLVWSGWNLYALGAC